jgi:HK97 family phage major capsid protein
MPFMDVDQFSELRRSVRNIWGSRPADAVAERRADLVARQDQLVAYAHRSQPQEAEFEANVAEIGFLDEMLGERSVAERKAELTRISRAAEDPANCESGDGGGIRGEYGTDWQAPPSSGTIRRTRGRGPVWRTTRPWDDLDDAVFHGNLVSRAYDVLDSYSDDVVSRAGRERIGELLSDEDEQGPASKLAVALGSPHYRDAYRAVMADPVHGSQFWTSLQRDAAARVNQLMRAATIATGSLGWALPLDLDPTVRLTNAGSANPWRMLSTVKSTTSNFWRGITSSGASASWLGEAAAASDGTPTLVNMDITPIKAAAWLFGSYEAVGWTQSGSDGDVDFASSLQPFLDDAKDQLEVAAFTTGATGTGQPTGLLTAIGTASDLTLGTGAWTMSGVAAIKEAVPPRFRLGRGSRTAWLANIGYLDKTLQIPQFTGALTALVDSSGDTPRMLGAPMYECSAMSTATGTGTRVLVYGDFSQNFVVDRWPGFTLFEPMLKGTGASANLPTAQSGWFYVWRTGMGQTTTGAWRVGKN